MENRPEVPNEKNFVFSQFDNKNPGLLKKKPLTRDGAFVLGSVFENGSYMQTLQEAGTIPLMQEIAKKHGVEIKVVAETGDLYWHIIADRPGYSRSKRPIPEGYVGIFIKSKKKDLRDFDSFWEEYKSRVDSVPVMEQFSKPATIKKQAEDVELSPEDYGIK